MENRKKILLIFSSLLIVVFGFIFIKNGQEDHLLGSSYAFTQQGTINGWSFSLATVATPLEMQKGLSGHRPLQDHEGLLFKFKSEDSHGIWMKDMLFAIDVLWLDGNMRVVSIKENFEPGSYPLVAYPQVPSLYVLEIAAGIAREANIKIGDMLILENE